MTRQLLSLPVTDLVVVSLFVLWGAANTYTIFSSSLIRKFPRLRLFFWCPTWRLFEAMPADHRLFYRELGHAGSSQWVEVPLHVPSSPINILWRPEGFSRQYLWYELGTMVKWRTAGPPDEVSVEMVERFVASIPSRTDHPSRQFMLTLDPTATDPGAVAYLSRIFDART